MQRNSSTLLVLCLLLLCSIAFTLSAQQSVVAIDVNSDGKYDGHGVAWKAPGAPGNFVVTTLHLVAGRQGMRVQTAGGVGTANIVKVYTDADLALLAVQGLQLQHIQADNAAVPPKTAQYWSFDNLNRRFDNSPIKMRGNKALGNLHVKLKKPKNLQKFTQNLCKPQYPSLQANVIKLKTPVRPGHSGSPIINANGQLVGLIDGGLVNIGIQNVFWSVPAKHFNTLWNQPPYQNQLGQCKSDTKFLYSGARTVVEDDRRYIEIFSLGKAGQMKFEEIYYSMLEEDQEYVHGLLQEEREYLSQASPEELDRLGAPVTIEELLSETVEIYVDYTTGATIAFPVGYDITQQEKKNNSDEEQPPSGANLIEFDGSGEWADLDGFIVVANKDNKYEAEIVRQWYQRYLEEEYEVSELKVEFSSEFSDAYDDSEDSFYDSFVAYVSYDNDDQGNEDNQDYFQDGEQHFNENEEGNNFQNENNDYNQGNYQQDTYSENENTDYNQESYQQDEENQFAYQNEDQNDYGNQYYQENSQDEETEYSIVSSITIDDFQFLGIAFKSDELEKQGRETRKRFYLMEICITLAGFQYN